MLLRLLRKLFEGRVGDDSTLDALTPAKLPLSEDLVLVLVVFCEPAEEHVLTTLGRLLG